MSNVRTLESNFDFHSFGVQSAEIKIKSNRERMVVKNNHSISIVLNTSHSKSVVQVGDCVVF